MSNTQDQPDITRPYLVIPKLVEQPTWGGQHIVKTKGWLDRPGHDIKIGQAYEFFSGSNLSLLNSTDNPNFAGELTDRDAVQIQTHPENSVCLSGLIATSPESVLGTPVVAERGPKITLLIKYTQALGNSFQVHIKDGLVHPKWKAKPESWYYFEPGLLTLGVKPGTDWSEYETAVTKIRDHMIELGNQVATGAITYEQAQTSAKEISEKYNLYQYVNTVPVEKDDLIDLTSGGLHHSWEEDPTHAPLGNVLLELQSEAMDDVSTFRSYDKGKLGRDGAVRPVHIQEYFEFIDRSPETNNPKNHIRQAQKLAETDAYRMDHLLDSRHFGLDKLTFFNAGTIYHQPLTRYQHLFVKSGQIEVSGGGTTLTLGTAHSCFVPASTTNYNIKSLSSDTQVLISY